MFCSILISILIVVQFVSKKKDSFGRQCEDAVSVREDVLPAALASYGRCLAIFRGSEDLLGVNMERWNFVA